MSGSECLHSFEIFDLLMFAPRIFKDFRSADNLKTILSYNILNNNIDVSRK